MRFSFTNLPNDQLDIAPGAPTPVDNAKRIFDEMADAYHEAQARVLDLPEQEAVAMGEAHNAAAEARVMGGTPPKGTPDQVKAKFQVAKAQANTELDTAAIALDSAGNNLRDAIIANKAAWLTSLEKTEVAAQAKLAKSLVAAREAIETLASARCAPAWLAGFGNQDDGGFAVQSDIRLKTLPGIARLDSTTSAVSLLDILEAHVVSPPEPRKARPVTVAVESSENKPFVGSTPMQILGKAGHGA